MVHFLAILVAVSFSMVFNVRAVDMIELTPTQNHHIIELNSNQPYVAGFHVNTPNLDTPQRGLLATAITVSFPSTDPSYFPPNTWLGGGMFVQAQDSRYTHIDYGFYTMLVADASGDLFLDIGLHQTREETTPIQMATEQLVYGYTWHISGIDYATPVTLYAKWDSEGWVHYSISANGANITFYSINVAGLPDCENIIRKFYAGNVYNMPFPFGRYVQYFQFGVVSSKAIPNTHWSVDLRNPRFLTETEWNSVDIAWSVEGDISYLDNDWRWGGMPYYGVSAIYPQNPLENPYEVIFSYSNQTINSGTVLWNRESSSLRDNRGQAIVKDSQYIVFLILTLRVFLLALFCNARKNG